jgi:hypothetical protein
MSVKKKPELKIEGTNFAAMEPEDEEDFLKRALFYAHCLDGFCRKQVETMIQSGRIGEYGPEIQNVCENGISDLGFGKATKELTCISLHLVGLDHCENQEPAWLVEFLFESIRETDRLFPEPSAQEVIRKHGSWKEEHILGGIAMNACRNLGFGEDEQIRSALENFLTASRPVRSELLALALTQPFAVLRETLELYD